MEPLITPQEIHIYESLDQITVKRKTKLGKLMELQFFLNDQKPLGKLHKYKNKWYLTFYNNLLKIELSFNKVRNKGLFIDQTFMNTNNLNGWILYRPVRQIYLKLLKYNCRDINDGNIFDIHSNGIDTNIAQHLISVKNYYQNDSNKNTTLSLVNLNEKTSNKKNIVFKLEKIYSNYFYINYNFPITSSDAMILVSFIFLS